MCNVYETPTPDQMEFDFAGFERPNESYKASIGPRDSGPFVVQGKIRVGQWGMIRPGSPERVARDAKGRPLMTNNARTERMATAPTYRVAWRKGDRCLIPARSYIEPYWGTGKNIFWRFKRSDGALWMLGGL